MSTAPLTQFLHYRGELGKPDSGHPEEHQLAIRRRYKSDPAVAYRRKEFVRYVHKEISLLPNRQTEVAELKLKFEYSSQEIAEKSGINITAVRKS